MGLESEPEQESPLTPQPCGLRNPHVSLFSNSICFVHPRDKIHSIYIPLKEQRKGNLAILLHLCTYQAADENGCEGREIPMPSRFRL